MPSQNKEVVKSTLIPTSYPVMNTGIAMPYVALFNFAQLPIFNPVTNRPLGAYITKFSFKYEVDEDTEANIEIMVGNYQVVDIPDIQEKMLLFIQWGYIYSEGRSFSHKPKIVKIEEVDYTFDDRGTQIRIKAKALTKDINFVSPVINPTYRSVDDGIQNMVQAMDNGFGKGIGIIIRKFKSKEDNNG